MSKYAISINRSGKKTKSKTEHVICSRLLPREVLYDPTEAPQLTRTKFFRERLSLEKTYLGEGKRRRCLSVRPTKLTVFLKVMPGDFQLDSATPPQRVIFRARFAIAPAQF